MRLLKFVKKIPQYDLKGNIDLFPIGDMHIGSYGTDYEELGRYIKHIEKRENRYVALMGDEIEAEIPSRSAKWGYDQEYQIDEQLDKLYKIFKPLKQQEKIITKVSSTHTGWTRKLIGHDIDKEIAEKLGADYLGVGGYWKLNADEKKYTLYQQHGSSSSKYPQFELIKCMDIYPGADVYLMGHIHQISARPYSKRYAFGDKEFEKNIWGIRTGAFVKDKMWAHEKLLLKPNIGCPIIHFNSNRLDIKVDIDSI